MDEPKKLVKSKRVHRTIPTYKVRYERCIGNGLPTVRRFVERNIERDNDLEERNKVGSAHPHKKEEKNSFITKPDKHSEVSRFDRASNRRSASRYIPNH